MHSHVNDERNADIATDAPSSLQLSCETLVAVEGGGKVRARRFANALLSIDPGACNPSGIAYAIAEACREAREEGVSTKDDPAVRLMVTQLAWVCRADSDTDDYATLVADCRCRAAGN